jgi:hypothetical protein
MVVRNHPRGRLVFDRDAIVRAALRAYVEARVAKLPNGLWFPVCELSDWKGEVQHGALRNDDGSGGYEVVAWTEAGVVGLAFQLGFGPIALLGLTPDTVTGGPDDVRGAVPGLPAELEPAFQMAASMLETRDDLHKGKGLHKSPWYSERLAGVGFWLYGDRVEGTLFTDPKAPGAVKLLPWGMLQNGRLPFWVLGELAAKAAERARTTDAPIHAIIDAVVDRALKGPTEFTTDELATLVPKPPDPERQLSVQRRLQEVGITWPGSPELPPEPLPQEPRINPFTGKPMVKPTCADK